MIQQTQHENPWLLGIGVAMVAIFMIMTVIAMVTTEANE